MVGVRTMTTEFGYLFRHYWIPATNLRYETSTVQLFPDGHMSVNRRSITQRMTKCDANSCTWREKTTLLDEAHEEQYRFYPASEGESICEYDRSQQAFYERAIGSSGETSRITAQQHALLRQPILTPLLPIPCGFQWHVRAKQADENADYLEYTLESVRQINGMTVLFVRKRGEFYLDGLLRYKGFTWRFGTPSYARLRIVRSGITAYSLDRSVVLEDRTHDVVMSDHQRLPVRGLETWNIRKLVESLEPLD